MVCAAGANAANGTHPSHPLYNTTRRIFCIFSAIQIASSVLCVQYNLLLASFAQLTSHIWDYLLQFRLKSQYFFPTSENLRSPETKTDFQVISHFCKTCCTNAAFHIFCTGRKSAVGDDWLCVVPNDRNKERLVLDVCFFALFALATSLSTELLVVTIGQKKSRKRRKTAANIDTFPVFLCSSNPSPPAVTQSSLRIVVSA